MDLLEKIFKLKKNNTTIAREAIGGATTFVVMGLTFSIADGIGAAFIFYCLLKLVTRRAKEGHWLIYLFAVLFALYFISNYFVSTLVATG